MTTKEAKRLREIIETASQSLDDQTALEAVCLHPEWQTDMAYIVGRKVQRIGRLWKCRQEHTSQADWAPEMAASLWEEICEAHAGTAEDPIPYNNNMELIEGLYYIQDGVVYLCNRSTGQAVYNPLSELVGLYVEVI